jgi:anti-anti-sigma regulatory factor/two-component sensor histidine kinase
LEDTLALAIENLLQKKNNAHLSQLASVGQIAAGIAHEVKNPLTAVKGFLQLLKERYKEEYIHIAQSELENALATLQNFLQVAKPDLDDEPFESINLSVELDLLSNLFQDQYYRVTLAKNFEHPKTSILGKKNQLKKVFFNLLKNAFEAIPDKGTINVKQSVTDDSVIICIQDSGIGIPKNKLDLLGTPFFSTKQNGTGMGLTLVYSVIYQHNGTIEVESDEQTGTQFTITFPKPSSQKFNKGVVYLELQQEDNLKQYFITNRVSFEERLLHEAVTVREKINEILEVGNINLLNNAHKLVLLIIDGKDHEVTTFAKSEGVTWARHSLTLSFKLEWIQAVRRVMWDFLFNYDRSHDKALNREEFFNLEKRVNELMDLFLNNLFMSYSQFKDDLIRTQRELVDDLSVPIIPLTLSTSILPLIGHIDIFRSHTITEKVIMQVGTERRIQTLIIDLSGVVGGEPEVIKSLIGTIDGIKMMGCKTIITGLRPDFVKTMIQQGLSFENKAETKGTLQQALVDHL